MTRTASWSEPDAQAIIDRNLGREGPLLPILHDIQAAFGHVPREAIPVIAQALNLSRAEVYGVVTFYHDFKDAPHGRHVLKLEGRLVESVQGGLDVDPPRPEVEPAGVDDQPGRAAEVRDVVAAGGIAPDRAPAAPVAGIGAVVRDDEGAPDQAAQHQQVEPLALGHRQLGPDRRRDHGQRRRRDEGGLVLRGIARSSGGGPAAGGPGGRIDPVAQLRDHPVGRRHAAGPGPPGRLHRRLHVGEGRGHAHGLAVPGVEPAIGAALAGAVEGLLDRVAAKRDVHRIRQLDAGRRQRGLEFGEGVVAVVVAVVIPIGVLRIGQPDPQTAAPPTHLIPPHQRPPSQEVISHHFGSP
ncbi:hypothetical protein CNY89_07300 [Amaricoccus sp. HAR-UPW-R2A-40]|nr:hypothetical protein CNY89_07300 [Amaricoccus sp. HAR-UPW-R2A-40]